MTRISKLICSCLLIVAFGTTAFADSVFPVEPKKLFDWKAAWGNISLDKKNDPIIPAEHHAIKLSLKNTAQYCFTDKASLEDLKIYAKDINGDGKEDYILDTQALYGKVSKDCIEAICTDKEGCYIVAYVTGPVSQIMEASKAGADACPISAEKNKSCRADCSATQEQCPELFNYDFRIAYTKRIKDWDMHDAKYFPAGDGSIASPYVKNGTNTVLSFEQADKDCYGQEMSFNNGKCNKYLQWDGEYAGGFLRDLYRIYTPPVTADNAMRFTTVPFSAKDSTPDVRGQKLGEGFGFALGAAGTGKEFFAIQMPSFDTGSATNQSAFTCLEIRNSASKDYFIPTNSDEEIRSFVNNPPEGISVQACGLRYTDWSGGPFMANDAKAGVLDCGQLSGLPCHTEQEIFAERYCERSTGALTTCDECVSGLELAEIVSPDDTDGGYGRSPVGADAITPIEKNKIKSKHLFSLPAEDKTGPDVAKYRGSVTSYTYYEALMNLLIQYDKPLYDSLMSYAKTNKASLITGLSWYMKLYRETVGNSNPIIRQAGNNLIYGQRVKVVYEETSACQRSTLCHIAVNCTHGASCMPPKVKILMADGTEKAIGEIKVGESVLGFKSTDMLGKLVPGKITAIKVTDDQPILSLNDTDLTPNHPVVLATNKVALSAAIGKNDKLVDKDGKIIDMHKITRQKIPTTVFNLEVEGLDGFVANGVRVMDESIQNSMAVKK